MHSIESRIIETNTKSAFLQRYFQFALQRNMKGSTVPRCKCLSKRNALLHPLEHSTLFTAATLLGSGHFLRSEKITSPVTADSFGLNLSAAVQ